MQTLLISLRGLIAVLVALLFWYVLRQSVDAGTLVGLLLPVWIGGVAGGAVCAAYSRHHALLMAAICGLTLALGFLYGRWAGGAGMLTLAALWPLWFPASFYVGCVVYLQVSTLVAGSGR